MLLTCSKHVCACSPARWSWNFLAQLALAGRLLLVGASGAASLEFPVSKNNLTRS